MDGNSCGQLKLDDLVEVIPRIYRRLDRGRTLWDVAFHTVHHLGELEPATRDGRDHEFLEHLADAAMWFFTLCGRLNHKPGATTSDRDTDEALVICVSVSLGQIMAARYPTIRPDSPLDEIQQILGPGFSPGSVATASVTALQCMANACDAIVRMYSYVGEVRQGEPEVKQRRLEDALASVCYSLFAVSATLRTRTTIERSTLSQIIWDRYGNDSAGDFVCRKCEFSECRCPVLLVPIDASVTDVVQRWSVAEEQNVPD